MCTNNTVQLTDYHVHTLVTTRYPLNYTNVDDEDAVYVLLPYVMQNQVK